MEVVGIVVKTVLGFRTLMATILSMQRNGESFIRVSSQWGESLSLASNYFCGRVSLGPGFVCSESLSLASNYFCG